MLESQRAAILKRLHIVGIVEGTSMLLLVFIAMPLKYLANQPMAVTIVGSAHGVLWLAYLLVLAEAWIKLKWAFSTVFIGGVASVLPFGPWWFESWVKRRLAAEAT